MAVTVPHPTTLLVSSRAAVAAAILLGEGAESPRPDPVKIVLRAGGSVLTDNTRTHPEELAGYVQYVRARTDATSADLPVGNGVEWTVKL